MTNDNANQQPTDKPIHMFKHEESLTGDIILNTNPNGIVSIGIRKATKSPISHAAICTSPGFFIEADGHGVHRFLLDVMCVQDLGSVHYLRLKEEVPNSIAIATKAGQKAERYLARGYWTYGALASITPLNIASNGKFFCSHLVAQAYQEAGIDLFNGKSPTKIVPGDFLLSEKFTDITGSMLLPPTIPQRWQPIRPMEERGKQNVHVKDIALQQSVNQLIANVFRSVGLSPPDDMDDVVQRLCTIQDRTIRTSVDARVTEIIRREYTPKVVASVFQTANSVYDAPAILRAAIKKGWSRENISAALSLQKRRKSQLDAIVAERSRRLEILRRVYEQTSLQTCLAMADTLVKEELMVAMTMESVEMAIGELEIALVTEDNFMFQDFRFGFTDTRGGNAL